VGKDRVLKILHGYRMSPFNVHNQPMPSTSLANASGFLPNEAEAYADTLSKLIPPLVERFVEPEPKYRITSAGVNFVQVTESQWYGWP
jgi:hypothetical protein